jgi:hypothetical protein
VAWDVVDFIVFGAIIARFQPHGMVRALYATALAQAAVAVIALIAGWGSTGPIWPKDILIPRIDFGSAAASLWVSTSPASNELSVFQATLECR